MFRTSFNTYANAAAFGVGVASACAFSSIFPKNKERENLLRAVEATQAAAETALEAAKTAKMAAETVKASTESPQQRSSLEKV